MDTLKKVNILFILMFETLKEAALSAEVKKLKRELNWYKHRYDVHPIRFLMPDDEIVCNAFHPTSINLPILATAQYKNDRYQHTILLKSYNKPNNYKLSYYVSEPALYTNKDTMIVLTELHKKIIDKMAKDI